MKKNVDEKRDNYRSLYAIIGVLTITTRMTQIDENNIILKKRSLRTIIDQICYTPINTLQNLT